MEYITIGNVRIEKTASLAPMASVADKAMRTMCKKYGAALLTGEMASAKGLCYSDRKTAALLTVTDYERPMAIQLFGSEPEFMAKAAVIAAQYKPDFIDINCGCPVPKVAGNGAGSALMKDPVLLGHIVEAVVKATDIPVTVKIRKGWDEKNVNAVEVARVAQESGASAVAVHGRTKNQMYSGKADLDVIAEVKQALNIPVIGNGDIDSGESCKHMYDYTGCDLVMVGRAACGRPWIFSEIKHYLETGKTLPAEKAENGYRVLADVKPFAFENLTFVPGSLKEESSPFTMSGRTLETPFYSVSWNEDGQIEEPYSISAGLDYPGIGPMHANLAAQKRAIVLAVNDDEAIRAAYELTKLEGIIPALESAHALGALEKLNFKPDDVVVLTVSGRGDKDIETYLNN